MMSFLLARAIIILMQPTCLMKVLTEIVHFLEFRMDADHHFLVTVALFFLFFGSDVFKFFVVTSLSISTVIRV